MNSDFAKPVSFSTGNANRGGAGIPETICCVCKEVRRCLYDVQRGSSDLRYLCNDTCLVEFKINPQKYVAPVVPIPSFSDEQSGISPRSGPSASPSTNFNRSRFSSPFRNHQNIPPNGLLMTVVGGGMLGDENSFPGASPGGLASESSTPLSFDVDASNNTGSNLLIETPGRESSNLVIDEDNNFTQNFKLEPEEDEQDGRNSLVMPVDSVDPDSQSTSDNFTDAVTPGPPLPHFCEECTSLIDYEDPPEPVDGIAECASAWIPHFWGPEAVGVCGMQCFRKRQTADQIQFVCSQCLTCFSSGHCASDSQQSLMSWNTMKFCSLSCFHGYLATFTEWKTCTLCSNPIKCNADNIIFRFVGSQLSLYCSTQCFHLHKSVYLTGSCGSCGAITDPVEGTKIHIESESQEITFCKPACEADYNMGYYSGRKVKRLLGGSSGIRTGPCSWCTLERSLPYEMDVLDIADPQEHGVDPHWSSVHFCSESCILSYTHKYDLSMVDCSECGPFASPWPPSLVLCMFSEPESSGSDTSMQLSCSIFCCHACYGKWQRRAYLALESGSPLRCCRRFVCCNCGRSANSWEMIAIYQPVANCMKCYCSPACLKLVKSKHIGQSESELLSIESSTTKQPVIQLRQLDLASVSLAGGAIARAEMGDNKGGSGSVNDDRINDRGGQDDGGATRGRYISRENDRIQMARDHSLDRGYLSQPSCSSSLGDLTGAGASTSVEVVKTMAAKFSELQDNFRRRTAEMQMEMNQFHKQLSDLVKANGLEHQIQLPTSVEAVDGASMGSPGDMVEDVVASVLAASTSASEPAGAKSLAAGGDSNDSHVMDYDVTGDFDDPLVKKNSVPIVIGGVPVGLESIAIGRCNDLRMSYKEYAEVVTDSDSPADFIILLAQALIPVDERISSSQMRSTGKFQAILKQAEMQFENFRYNEDIEDAINALCQKSDD